MFANVRVRFAPSPTGNLHIGNIRTALFNYLFAKQKKGAFVLRIEDTDAARNSDESAHNIMQDLSWLQIIPDEDFEKGGAYGPYLQSERTDVYKKHLQDLKEMGHVYSCFCTPEVLQQKREQQQLEKKPPRYDRTCLHISDDERNEKLQKGAPHVFRFKVDHEKVVTIKTMERGTIEFALKNFTDFTLTRSDGSFTFLFTNFIDDWLMNISHVIRGEDHLSNTAMQAALFDALAAPLPTFWHLSMLCGTDGKKLSKRDFGASLHDLRNAGFLFEAITNYLLTLGASFSDEIQSFDELVSLFNFENLHTTGSITYDVEKLRWMNQQWMMRLSNDELCKRARPFFEKRFETVKTISSHEYEKIVKMLREETKTLHELAEFSSFYFEEPEIKKEEIKDDIYRFILRYYENFSDKKVFLHEIKKGAIFCGLKLRDVFGTIRYLLTGNFKGIGIKALFDILPEEVIRKRLLK